MRYVLAYAATSSIAPCSARRSERNEAVFRALRYSVRRGCRLACGRSCPGQSAQLRPRL
jgi:hypothetical protein